MIMNKISNEMNIRFTFAKKTPVNTVAVEFDSKISATKFLDNKLIIKISEKIDSHAMRLMIRLIIRTAQTHQIKKVAVNFSEIAKFVKYDTQDLAELLAYEIQIANYNFNTYKTKPKKGFPEVKEVVFVGVAKAELQKRIQRGQQISSVVNQARDVANTPAQDMTPKKLARMASASVKGIPNTKVKILNKKQIQKEKMGAFLGVSQGSYNEPQLIIMEYNGGKTKEEPLVIIGKGVTYDTGGLGLKPAEHMIGMHMDMTGGAMAIYSFIAIAKLGIKKNLVAIVPASENTIGAKSYRNGDILKSMSGKTIEIKHTDAEGRLLLADALTYAQKYYKPELIIDIATLTGASVVALGQHASAIFSHEKKCIKMVQDSSLISGEKVWPLPLWSEYTEYMKSKVADLSNISSAKYGGAITAAAFLSEFVDKKQKWIHIDIAPRMESVESDNLAHGATGEPIYLLTKLAEIYK